MEGLSSLLSGQVNEKNLSLGIKVAKGMWRNQDQASREPMTSVRDQIAHRPSLVIEVEISDVTDLAVRGA